MGARLSRRKETGRVATGGLLTLQSVLGTMRGMGPSKLQLKQFEDSLEPELSGQADRSDAGTVSQASIDGNFGKRGLGPPGLGNATGLDSLGTPSASHLWRRLHCPGYRIQNPRRGSKGSKQTLESGLRTDWTDLN